MGTLNTSWGHRLRGMLAALLMIGATVVVILLLTSQHSSAQQAAISGKPIAMGICRPRIFTP